MENKPIYKTAEELGIEQWEHDGLAALIGPLSRNELDIDMRCKTVACIGGHVYHHANRAIWNIYGVATPGFGKKGATGELYWPTHKSAWECNASQAACAIVNFLVTGDPQWAVVMAEG